MKVSLLITARNYGKYLEECLQSCLNQTVKPYEIIYSDDCSEDNSVEIAKRLNIPVIKHSKHVGVVQARNDAARVSKGNYLIFVDGDDILGEYYIEKMLSVLDTRTVVVYSIVQQFGEKNNLLDYNCQRDKFLWKENYINTSALIRKSAFIEAGMWQETGYNTHWDWHLFLRLSRLGKIKKSRAILKYRIHSDSNLNEIRKRYKADLVTVRHNIVKSLVNVTIGLVYGGRIEKFIYKWMDNLVSDIEILFNKPQLIIINNSQEKLKLSKYDKYFSEIKILKGNTKSMRTKETRPLLSRMLSDCYNMILENAEGEIVHLREDDNLSHENSFEKVFNYLIETNITASAALYTSRHRNYIVGGHYKDDKVMLTNSIKDTKPVQVDFTGTGYIMYWRDLVPNYVSQTSFGELSHDWAWSLKLKSMGGTIHILPEAQSRHYKTETDYLLPDMTHITPAANYSRRVEDGNKPLVLIKEKFNHV